MSRHTPVSPINSSEQYYLVDVVAFILKYLKDQLYEALSKDNQGQVEFDWVVTVPAIWDIRGKQMMREAAYKVSQLYIYYMHDSISSEQINCIKTEYTIVSSNLM